jgi:predicted nucleic acid-binding protein
MKSDYPVILDACVLLPMPLADTLLRMAETPRLYLPRWSDDILAEVSRNLVSKFGKTEAQAQRREAAFRSCFPEALVTGYRDLVPVMKNDPKDRHVLAACVANCTKRIVTYNQKDFSTESREPYGIKCCGPSTFLNDLYDLEPGIVAQKLTEQAQGIGLTIENLLLKLRVNVPGFVSAFCEAQKIDLDDLG